MSDKPMNRRRFFREGLFELLKPLDRVVRPIEELAKQVGKLDEMQPRQSRPPVEVKRAPNTVSYSAPSSQGTDDVDDTKHFIRPPGARSEQDFLNICSRCGNCVHACPVNAIQLDYSQSRAGGAPYIDPDSSACVMCDGLSCMSQCPSSALMIVPREEIDIGTAAWNSGLCLRTVTGEPCTLCVDHCPVGTAALEVVDNHVIVHEDHCTGCGACQNNCPTSPKSIVVTPKSQREAEAAR
ncbi:MAG TPA: 4Fe-4S dicluster domain-containing protein [Tepidisphaeraceae bacterium]|jgi:ferredoxin-type protein NapG|nr:4Fe-4S dicluster domain-containing protein [Tepidisphaeraceae bacterium]